MSAIWQKNLKEFQTVQLLSAQLEPRDVPEVFGAPMKTNLMHDYLLSWEFGDPFTNWLKGAVIQTAYNGSQPVWSLDGWSFAPVNLSSISKTLEHPSANMTASRKIGSLNLTNSDAVLRTNISVTLQTPAVRGRIECSSYETLSNSSSWSKSWNLRDQSFWNVSSNPKEPARGYELLSVISLSPQMNTSTFADSARIMCCANGTNKEPNLSSVGYWSINSIGLTEDSHYSLGVAAYNFTVKWIVGRPIHQQFLDLDDKSHFIWQEQPSIAALNCQPIVETAEACVKIDVISGDVQSFSIITSPKVATSAWSDNYEAHDPTDKLEDWTNFTTRWFFDLCLAVIYANAL